MHVCVCVPSTLHPLRLRPAGRTSTHTGNYNAGVGLNPTDSLCHRKRKLSGAGKGAWGCGWECKLKQVLWRTEGRLLRKLKIELPCDPEPPSWAYIQGKPSLEKTHAPQCSQRPYLQRPRHGSSLSVHRQTTGHGRCGADTRWTITQP